MSVTPIAPPAELTERELMTRIAAIDARLDELLEGIRAAIAYTRESKRRLREPVTPAPPLAGSLRARARAARRRELERELEEERRELERDCGDAAEWDSPGVRR